MKMSQNCHTLNQKTTLKSDLAKIYVESPHYYYEDNKLVVILPQQW